MNYLIVGLGNFGNAYKNTRHNIGFMIIDDLSLHYGFTFKESKYAFEAEHNLGNVMAYFIKPTTYMNNSGKAVVYYMQQLKISLDRLLIVVDDLDFDFGICKIKLQGSSGGHNGLLSIEEKLGTRKYARLRMGIGRNYLPGEQANYVVSVFRTQEKEHLNVVIKNGSGIVSHILANGTLSAMNIFNKNKLL
ncbi:MAG: aminoacyl-tRNA hydrolase [Solitalea-like symbiont of Acarus siro]